jgi:hypothetical protein
MLPEKENGKIRKEEFIAKLGGKVGRISSVLFLSILMGDPFLLYFSLVLAVITILFMNMITDITAFKNLHAGENQTKTQTEVNNISPKQAKDLMDKEKDVFVLDVRTEEEYKEVHIKDAHLIPIKELEQNIDKIP